MWSKRVGVGHSQCHFLSMSGQPKKLLAVLVPAIKRRIPANEKYKLNGFDVLLSPIGAYCENPEVLDNSGHNPTQYQWTDTGFNITLKRIIQPYLYKYYFPSIAIVIVSFISFIIPLSAIPGRIVLVVTQFLTLTSIFIHQMVS